MPDAYQAQGEQLGAQDETKKPGTVWPLQAASKSVDI
jgi:hypothetical protein